MDSHNTEEVAFENPVEAVGFAQLRHVIMLDHELSDGAYRTFATYIKYAQQGPSCFPGIETIAKARNKSAGTISRHNQELESLGYIRRQRRTGTSTVTIIRDLNQIPRLQELAIKELQEREHRKNERSNISKMQCETSQKCDVEEEQVEEESSKNTESPPATISPESPSTFQEWLTVFRDPATNKPAALRKMYQTLYPEHPPPDYGYCGKVAGRVGGYEVLAMRLWELSIKPPVGDVLAYVQGIKKNKGSNGRHDRNAAIIEKARQKYRQDPALEAEYRVL